MDGVNPLLSYFWSSKKRNLNKYLALDDVTFLDTLKKIAFGRYGRATNLAKRFFARELLRCFEPPQPNLVGEFKRELKKGAIEYRGDKTPSKGYKQFEIFSEGYLNEIMIQNADNKKPEAFGRSSPLVVHFASQTKFRFYFFSEKDRDKAEKIWKKLQ